MEPLLTSMPCVLVSTIFCMWNHYQLVHLRRQRRQRRLRERVAYMLWVTAHRAA